MFQNLEKEREMFIGRRIYADPDDEDDEDDKKANDNKQPETTDILDLETEKSAEQEYQGQRLKILTPNQMLSRLPSRK